jgi:type IV pilus assembly protein PilV
MADAIISGIRKYFAEEPAAGEVEAGAAGFNNELPGARVDICFDSAPFDGSGLPQWACTAGGTNAPLVVKIGWTRSSTDGRGLAKATIPSVVLPVTPGSEI